MLSEFGGLGLSACSDRADTNDVLIEDASNNFASRLGFDSIMGSRLDAAVVPEGYRAQVLAPWGTESLQTCHGHSSRYERSL